jgi:flagellar assembly factor FliW
MEILTTRFGTLQLGLEQMVVFPDGLWGYSDHQHWVVLAENHHDDLGWMQSVRDPRVALPVASPCRLGFEQPLRVAAQELQPLKLDDPRQALVLAVLQLTQQALTINLRTPLVVNLARRLGRQVLVRDGQPDQPLLPEHSARLRKCA